MGVLLFALACDDNGGDQAGGDASVDTAVREPRAMAKSHTLYVNTEAVTIIPGHHDATMNRTTFADQPTVLAPFLASDPDRQSTIDEVVGELRRLVAPYNIAIETARPAAGPYHMLVMTDSPATDLGLAEGLIAITPSTCNSEPSVIAFEFGYAGTSDASKRDRAVRNALAMFADLAAVPLSRKANDCMCLVGDVCSFLAGPCTIGGPGTAIETNAGCPGGDTEMNEDAVFLEVFGAR